MLKKAFLAAVGAICVTLTATEAVQAAIFEVVASGLDNPRAFTFGPDGALYITEAGTGGPSDKCVPSPSQPGASLCYGQTGAVTRVQNGVQERVLTGFPSIGLSNGDGSYGPHDIAFTPDGKAYVLVGFASDSRNRENVVEDSNIGQIHVVNSFDGGASWTPVADVLGYELGNDPDKAGFISNPYSFVIQNGTAYVVDAGANTFLRAELDGSGVALERLLESRLEPHPFTGEPALTESVPTAVVVGPDGALYVAELTGRPYPEREARIYRIVPGNEPEIYADNFTQIVDLGFDSKNNLYVLQYADASLTNDSESGVLNRLGSLIRVTPDGTRTTVESGLVSPNSLLVGSDDSIYISEYATFAGKGQIVRFDPRKSVPEPTSALSLLAFGAFGTFLLSKHNKGSSIKVLN